MTQSVSEETFPFLPSDNPADDKQTSFGSLTDSAQTFGDSWSSAPSYPGVEDNCGEVEPACPEEVRAAAKKACRDAVR